MEDNKEMWKNIYPCNQNGRQTTIMEDHQNGRRLKLKTSWAEQGHTRDQLLSFPTSKRIYLNFEANWT